MGNGTLLSGGVIERRREGTKAAALGFRRVGVVGMSSASVEGESGRVMEGEGDGSVGADLESSKTEGVKGRVRLWRLLREKGKREGRVSPDFARSSSAEVSAGTSGRSLSARQVREGKRRFRQGVSFPAGKKEEEKNVPAGVGVSSTSTLSSSSASTSAGAP